MTAAPSPPVPPVMIAVRAICQILSSSVDYRSVAMRIVTEPSAHAPTVRPMLVRDLTDGMEVDQVLLVRAAEVRTKAGGDPYLRLTLGDRTGAAVAMVWDDVAEAA